MGSNFLPVITVCLASFLVGVLFAEKTYPSEVIDKMIEVCHNNNEIEKFVSRNRNITVHCKNGAHFIITAK